MIKKKVVFEEKLGDKGFVVNLFFCWIEMFCGVFFILEGKIDLFEKEVEEFLVGVF